MKIELINDHQIRCTLSKKDLSDRHLKISELAYGSDKAKDLFRDMMEQANIDFGFEADDIPLMIEAIPTSKDSIVLLITKVDDPAEFDEKFSKFGIDSDDEFDDGNESLLDLLSSTISDEPISDSDLPDEDIESSTVEQIDNLLEATKKAANEGNKEFIPLSEALKNGRKKAKKKEKESKTPTNLRDKMRVFSFCSLDPIINVARHNNTDYSGKNTLWKNNANDKYFLLLNRGQAKKSFVSICTKISEFGKEESITYATPDYYNEHFQLIIKDKALSKLSQL